MTPELHEQFTQWAERWQAAAKTWLALVPRKVVQVGDGRGYHLPNEPATGADWADLGWSAPPTIAGNATFPTGKNGTPLAAASTELATACEFLGVMDHSSPAHNRLLAMLQGMQESLMECGDPISSEQRDDVRSLAYMVEDAVFNLPSRASLKIKQRRRQAESDESLERVVRRLAEVADDDKAAKQSGLMKLHAFSAWGRAMLIFLLRQEGGLATTGEVEEKGVAAVETKDSERRRTVQATLRILRASCRRQGGCPPCDDHLGLVDYPAGKTRGTLQLTEKGAAIAKALKEGKL